ncbi:MAG: Sialic acid TRAP transporter permease protein SiaT [Lentisphaerae bacterium ADurb.BinA184]|nr:MAG: Sialic acid TRAP transporter permease protein SiaT [Lentisphaerae bacterium ADurb.BinA184]
MTPTTIGLLGLAVLVVLLISSLPVAFAMAITGLLGFAIVRQDLAAAMSMSATTLYETFADYNLTVIPLFVLMGQVAFHSGISRRLFHAADCWMGWLRGGLAMATVGACTVFGAICGSGPATAATMASVALPEMKRYGYSMELGTGTVAASGGIGMMIPPSVVFIVYGIMTEQSIGRLFISGILPGLLIAALFCGTIYVQCRRRPSLCPPTRSHTWGERLQALSGLVEAVLLFALVMGGMFVGWFTPTEGAAVGAGGCIALALFQRQITWKAFVQSLKETVRTSCMVMAIIGGAMVFGKFLAITRIPMDLAEWLAALPTPSWVTLAGIVVFYLIGGCFVDALALILLTVPVFYPVMLRLNFDPIWFGVMIVLVTHMGIITPPVGVNVYVVSGMERDVPLQAVFRGALPFVLALVVAAVLITVFPGIALWLPGLMR